MASLRTPLAFVLSYVLVAFSGVTVDYLTLSRLFPRRRLPVLWWCYFLTKATVDAHFWYAMSQGAQGTWVETVQMLWVFFMGVISFGVVLATFEGDMVLVCACAVFCDLYAGLCTSFGLVVGNFLCGWPIETGYVVSFGGNTLLRAAIILTFCLISRESVVQLLTWVCRLARRNRLVWGLAALCTMLVFISTTQRLAVYLTLSGHIAIIELFSGAMLIPVAFSLMRRAHDARRREAVLVECAALAASYDQTVREQLLTLERDMCALEGHERVLSELGRRDGDVLEQVRRLERAYRHLSAGTYCDRPALDAVLVEGAGRVRALGVRPELTVAGIPTHVVVPATVALTLLNLACEAAERTDDVLDAAMELRIRGVGEQVVFYLEVPERWGMLWARRYLRAFDGQGVVLVRERRQGDRRVVLVLSGEGRQ